MKILITGATGFVGSHLAEALVNAGREVRALARRSSNAELLKNLGAEIFEGDITDPAAVRKSAEGCGQVYHLAALTSRAGASKTQYHAINVTGTENVLRAALAANVERFVHVSSAGIYGTTKRAPVDDDTKPSPNSHYRATKLLAEQVVLSAAKTQGSPVVIARIASVIGPRSHGWLDLFKAVSDKRFRTVGKGDNHVHMGYVSDVVQGIRLCGDIRGINGRSYLISGAEAVTASEFIAMIAQQLGRGFTRRSVPATPFSAYHQLAQWMYRHFGLELPYSHRYELFFSDNIYDCSRARTELGYSPTVSMSEALYRTIRWYRENGLLA